MSNIAFTTDSNCGIPKEDAKEMGVTVIPMPFFINGKIYYEEVDLTQADFFQFLEDPNVEVSTSAPSPGDTMDIWNKLLETHDAVVHVPMSKAMSSSYSTSAALSEQYGGRVQVVDNQRISVTQRQSIVDGMNMAEAGYSAEKIRQVLEDERFQSSIYIMVDDLKYLKKGGRITPAAALIGSVLNLKPVLQIQGDVLDAFAKCRGLKKAKRAMLDAIHSDLDNRFKEYTEQGIMGIHYSFSGVDYDYANEWVEEIRQEFPEYEISGDPLSLNVSCHIGPGALAITCEKKVIP